MSDEACRKAEKLVHLIKNNPILIAEALVAASEEGFNAGQAASEQRDKGAVSEEELQEIASDHIDEVYYGDGKEDYDDEALSCHKCYRKGIIWGFRACEKLRDNK